MVGLPRWRRQGISTGKWSSSQLRLLFVPPGTPDNSPPIYRWVHRTLAAHSPGRGDRPPRRRPAACAVATVFAGFCRPWRDWSVRRGRSPTVETVGYFRLSLTGQNPGYLWETHTRSTRGAEWSCPVAEHRCGNCSNTRPPVHRRSDLVPWLLLSPLSLPDYSLSSWDNRSICGGGYEGRR